MAFKACDGGGRVKMGTADGLKEPPAHIPYTLPFTPLNPVSLRGICKPLFLAQQAAAEGETTDANTQNFEGKNDFWAVWQGAAQLFPARITRPFLRGMTGGALRSASCPLMQSDLHCWLIPGLALCGIQAELLPLPADASEWLQFLSSPARCHASIPVFGFEVAPANVGGLDRPSASVVTHGLRITPSRIPRRRGNPDREPSEQDEIELPRVDTGMARQALLSEFDRRNSCLTLTTQAGTQHVVRPPELPASYTHALCLRRVPQRQARAIYARAAIRQWAAFACACPDCVLKIEEEDAPVRQLAAEFWWGLAGKARSADATRLRHLATQFETAARSADIQAACAGLYALACASYTLPQEVENALLAPANSILTDGERLDLIYLCRAGTRDLKILAAHRLSCEREHADARNTLQQLRFDADSWVRKMADIPSK